MYIPVCGLKGFSNTQLSDNKLILVCTLKRIFFNFLVEFSLA